jgi:hypothetical protein
VTRLAILTIFTTLLLAAPVLAADHVGHDGGEGWWGLTNDKVVTNAGFLVIGGIPIFIFLMSLGQYLLDRRKDNRKKAAKARGTSPQWRGGW